MSLTVVAVILCVSAALQLGYFLVLLWPAVCEAGRNEKERMMETNQPPVSVVICACNEAENLKRHLPAVLLQCYADFEVIVINDRSDDQTAQVLLEMARQHPRLRIVTISPEAPRLFPGKKFALSKGVAAAANDFLLLTDADCQPASPYWLSAMVQPLTNGKEIVAGFGDFYQEKGALNAFIRGETLHTFLQLLAYQKAGMPYMAVGRNLACRKYLLEQAAQHPLWRATPSGDDDMLVRIGATKENMAVVTNPAAQTYSAAKSDFKSYIRQKQRHLSTGKLYRKKVSFLLALYAVSHAFFWMSSLFFFGIIIFTKNHFSGSWVMLAFLFFTLRCALFWYLLTRFQRHLRPKEKRVRFLPYFDFMWLLYNFAFSPYILWKNKQDWR